LKREQERILSLALEALYAERRRLNEEIEGIEQKLGNKKRSSTHLNGSGRGDVTRTLSALGRKAIAAAAKKRWAAYRAAKRGKQ
jgi:hypothetical protein